MRRTEVVNYTGFSTLAREYGKGSNEYGEIKVSSLECFHPNLFNTPNYKNPKYSFGTGYVYLDIDFTSRED
jgi:hypothetical protein